ncbi:MAG: penicillin-binding transpeptidase domain-containing protein [Bacteroidota bacterium]
MDSRSAILSRMFLILGLLLLLPCALAFQIIRINFWEGDGLRALHQQQAIEWIPIPAQRGNIYDANGTLLATHTIEYKLAYDPKAPGVEPTDVDSLIQRLADLTQEPESYYRTKVQKAPQRSRYIVLAKNIPGYAGDEIKAMGLKGTILEENYRRKYTFGSLAAHNLGFVNHELKGRIGLEAYYDEELRGIPGERQVRRDPLRRTFSYVGAPRKQPQQGYALHTTIDAYIQAILEDELQKGVEKHLAAYGTGIVMDPKTGAIKALANYPTFDPNFPGQSEDENRRNFAISDMIEPGSTIKLVTAIAAVEQNAVTFEEVFETPESGITEIHGLALRDHDPLGNMTFQEVIQKSSNIATAEIAMRMKPKAFYQYARNMGFGSETNIDLFGEQSGRLAKPYDWSLVTLPWMAHGYEMLTTPIQIAQAYAAFANNGQMMRPYMVDRIEDENGVVVKKNEPDEIRRIAKPSTIKKLLPVFESVVSDSGTGDYAMIDGLRIAGKTGTAKKVVNGRYENRYRGSFAGFFPVEDPKYVIYILLDDPRTSGYGGVVAAPIFREVANRIAGLDDDIRRNIQQADEPREHITRVPSVLGLPKEEATALLDQLMFPFEFEGLGAVVGEQSPAPGDTLIQGEHIQMVLSASSVAVQEDDSKTTFVSVPDVRGMSIRRALATLSQAGLTSEVIGSGTVFAQFPLAHANMRKGGTITIRGKAKSLHQLSEARKK